MTAFALTQSFKRSLWADALLVLAGSCFIALFAHVQIPLPFTPVPIVLQDFLIILSGVFFGSKRGACIAFAFLAQGACGLPVFAGGACGLMKFIGPTGGYLMGYLFAAFAAGWVVERFGRRTLVSASIAIVSASFVLFACGISVLSAFVGFPKALVLGLLPFIPGNLIKTLVSLRLLKTVKWAN